MTNIIVVFPKIENAKSIRNVLVRNGFSVTAACTTGAQALSQLEDYNEVYHKEEYLLASAGRPGRDCLSEHAAQGQ